jgi:hypothetical protein
MYKSLNLQEVVSFKFECYFEPLIWQLLSFAGSFFFFCDDVALRYYAVVNLCLWIYLRLTPFNYLLTL